MWYWSFIHRDRFLRTYLAILPNIASMRFGGGQTTLRLRHRVHLSITVTITYNEETTYLRLPAYVDVSKTVVDVCDR